MVAATMEFLADHVTHGSPAATVEGVLIAVAIQTAVDGKIAAGTRLCAAFDRSGIARRGCIRDRLERASTSRLVARASYLRFDTRTGH